VVGCWGRGSVAWRAMNNRGGVFEVGARVGATLGGCGGVGRDAAESWTGARAGAARCRDRS
jgi:hypothetical protein